MRLFIVTLLPWLTSGMGFTWRCSYL